MRYRYSKSIPAIDPVDLPVPIDLPILRMVIGAFSLLSIQIRRFFHQQEI
jgi:hypothetical protein